MPFGVHSEVGRLRKVMVHTPGTDVWVSMGEPKDVWTDRVKLLTPYQVNAALLEKP